MRYEPLVTGEYYHVYDRGVDRRVIFRLESDLVRFLEGMRVFNTIHDAGAPISFQTRCQRTYPIEDQLVRVHAFGLISNHFHLLLQQKEDFGISKFMHRHLTGYTQFINIQEKRRGALLESTFKARHVTSLAYLEHLTRYIHLNPLSLAGVDWKNQGIRDKQHAINFLTSFQWSSFYYYYHHIQTPIFDPRVLESAFASPDDHLKFMLAYEPPQNDESDRFF